MTQMPEIAAIRRQDTLDQMEVLTRKCLALHLKSLGMEFTNSALEELFDLFNMHINTSLTDLSKIVQVQRRSKATFGDVKILFAEHQITGTDLEEEYSRDVPNNVKQRKLDLVTVATKLASGESLNQDEYEILPTDPSFVFFAHNEDLSDLIPTSHNSKKKNTIPQWLPQFPPDHTYLKTPNFTNRITDQKVVRTKIAEESRYGESALDNLINLEKAYEEKEIHSHEKPSNSEASSNEEIQLTREESAILWTPGTEKRLDIVKYAQARIKFLKKKELQKQQEEVRQANLLNDDYLKNVNALSCYTAAKFDTDLEVTAQDLIDNQFKTALETFSNLMRQKAVREVKRNKLQIEHELKNEQRKAAHAAAAVAPSKDNATDEEAMFRNFDNFADVDSIENFENFGSEANVNQTTNLENSDVQNEQENKNSDVQNEQENKNSDSGDDDLEMVDFENFGTSNVQNFDTFAFSDDTPAPEALSTDGNGPDRSSLPPHNDS